MELEFRKDFEAVAARWDAFWKGGEDLSRPLVSIIVPKPGVEPVAKPEGSLSLVADNYDEVIDQALRWADSHLFMGEAIPHARVSFGPDHLAGLLGAELMQKESDRSTSWVQPFVEDWDAADLTFKREGKWWYKTVEAVDAFRSRLDGRMLVEGPNLSMCLDTLSAVRGPQNLLLDLTMEPDKVKSAQKRVCEAVKEIVDAFYDLLGSDTWGSITRHDMYCSGRIDVPQSDVSAMISPEMYKEFEVPYLSQMVKKLDAAEYHLDGEEAIRHLEAVCGIEGISVIQWQMGAGNGASKDWSDLRARIDSLGKGQVLFADPETAIDMWKRYSSKQLFFRVIGCENQSDAEAFMSSIEKVDK